MKKIIILLLVLLMTLSAVSAATWGESMQRSGIVQGAYGSVVQVVFSQIPTQSSSFALGMPFDIEGRLVQYSKTEDGRLISYWSVISNSHFKLGISAGKLESVDEKDGKKTELDYILKFTYSLGYKNVDGVQTTLTGSFSIDTEKKKCTYVGGDKKQKESTINNDNEFYEVDLMPSSKDGSMIGSVDGSVYFMFTENSTNKIKDGTDVLSGDYTATVTVKIYTEETVSHTTVTQTTGTQTT